MKIAAAQTRPFKGDITANISTHKKLIALATNHKADAIFFPELSLTGYEPELAAQLATSQEDSKLDVFQEISNLNKITIGVGLPTHSNSGINISMIIFQPNKARLTYSKRYLHPGEEAYFVSGNNILPIIQRDKKIAIAICYETSIPEHAETASKNGAEIYIASVLNSIQGIDKDINRISKIAKQYNMIALMSNYSGNSGSYACAGKTSIWNQEGTLVGQLNNTEEGILIIDTENQEIIQNYV